MSKLNRLLCNGIDYYYKYFMDDGGQEWTAISDNKGYLLFNICGRMKAEKIETVLKVYHKGLVDGRIFFVKKLKEPHNKLRAELERIWKEIDRFENIGEVNHDIQKGKKKT